MSAASESGIVLEGISKHFVDDRGQRVAAVDDVSLTVAPGELLVLLGPSGCGKTTLLRCLAGLETPDAGRIDIKGRTVFSSKVRVPGGERRVGMVFQSYALWPHMSVEQNVAYPLRNLSGARRMSRSQIDARVAELLGLMGLEQQARRRPGQLSGGQQQRVALARAIAAGNDVVLFDEPLSNIDAKVREQLRLELRRMQRELGFTAVYVTHDQTEALELADRIAVMREGRLVQLGTGRDVYRSPENRFVAEFVGTTNLLPVAGGSADTVTTDLGPVSVTGAGGTPEAGVVASRAHAWWVSSQAPEPGPNQWRGTVRTSAYLGWYDEHVVEVSGVPVRVWSESGADSGVVEGAEVWVGVAQRDCLLVTEGERG
jgi:iron(III) transport system ATP-binding protein